jgi:tetratricopeptide (TPR) repeat protein
MKKIIMLFLLVIITASIWCASQSQLALQANKAYSGKMFSQALQLYQTIEKQGVRNADLYYNIGYCYYRMNKMGEAILYYKRALRLNSASPAAHHNLQLALAQTRDQQYQADNGFIANLAAHIMAFLTLNRLAVLLVIFLLLVSALLAYIWILQQGEERLLPVFALILSLVLLLTTSILSIIKYNQFLSHKQAVLLQMSEGGFSGPGTDYTRVFTIHEGMIVSISRDENGWSQVLLPNGLAGWIPSSALARVNP